MSEEFIPFAQGGVTSSGELGWIVIAEDAAEGTRACRERVTVDGAMLDNKQPVYSLGHAKRLE